MSKIVEVKFSKQELKKLAECSESCVTLERKSRIIFVNPAQFCMLTKGIRNNMNALLFRYDMQFKSIIIGYDKVKLLSRYGTISYGATNIGLKIEADFYLFKPILGCKLKGVVCKRDDHYLGCLVHKTFNVSVPVMGESFKSGWDYLLGEEVEFIVDSLDLTSGPLPYIKGRLEKEKIECPKDEVEGSQVDSGFDSAQLDEVGGRGDGVTFTSPGSEKEQSSEVEQDGFKKKKKSKMKGKDPSNEEQETKQLTKTAVPVSEDEIKSKESTVVYEISRSSCVLEHDDVEVPSSVSKKKKCIQKNEEHSCVTEEIIERFSKEKQSRPSAKTVPSSKENNLSTPSESKAKISANKVKKPCLKSPTVAGDGLESPNLVTKKRKSILKNKDVTKLHRSDLIKEIMKKEEESFGKEDFELNMRYEMVSFNVSSSPVTSGTVTEKTKEGESEEKMSTEEFQDVKSPKTSKKKKNKKESNIDSPLVGVCSLSPPVTSGTVTEKTKESESEEKMSTEEFQDVKSLKNYKKKKNKKESNIDSPLAGVCSLSSPVTEKTKEGESEEKMSTEEFQDVKSPKTSKKKKNKKESNIDSPLAVVCSLSSPVTEKTKEGEAEEKMSTEEFQDVKSPKISKKKKNKKESNIYSPLAGVCSLLSPVTSGTITEKTEEDESKEKMSTEEFQDVKSPKTSKKKKRKSESIIDSPMAGVSSFSPVKSGTVTIETKEDSPEDEMSIEECPSIKSPKTNRKKGKKERNIDSPLAGVCALSSPATGGSVTEETKEDESEEKMSMEKFHGVKSPKNSKKKKSKRESIIDSLMATVCSLSSPVIGGTVTERTKEDESEDKMNAKQCYSITSPKASKKKKNKTENKMNSPLKKEKITEGLAKAVDLPIAIEETRKLTKKEDTCDVLSSPSKLDAENNKRKHEELSEIISEIKPKKVESSESLCQKKKRDTMSKKEVSPLNTNDIVNQLLRNVRKSLQRNVVKQDETGDALSPQMASTDGQGNVDGAPRANENDKSTISPKKPFKRRISFSQEKKKISSRKSEEIDKTSSLKKLSETSDETKICDEDYSSRTFSMPTENATCELTKTEHDAKSLEGKSKGRDSLLKKNKESSMLKVEDGIKNFQEEIGSSLEEAGAPGVEEMTDLVIDHSVLKNYVGEIKRTTTDNLAVSKEIMEKVGNTPDVVRETFGKDKSRKKKPKRKILSLGSGTENSEAIDGADTTRKINRGDNLIEILLAMNKKMLDMDDPESLGDKSNGTEKVLSEKKMARKRKRESKGDGESPDKKKKSRKSNGQ